MQLFGNVLFHRNGLKLEPLSLSLKSQDKELENLGYIAGFE